MIKAQKLKTYEFSKFKLGYASEKLNGIHAIWDGEKLYSRRPKEFEGLTELTTELKRIVSPNFTWVGELIIPGLHFEEMSGLIRNKQEVTGVVFNCFNCFKPSLKRSFKDYLPFLQTQKESDLFKVLNFQFIPSKSDFDGYYKRKIEEGAEGVCLISPNFVYKPGVRNWDWMKRVPMKSIEAKIIEILPGTKGKKFEHTLGSFVCMTEGKTFKVGIFKGFNTAWRDDIWATRESHVGKQATIEFKDFSRYGIPVQPRFKSFRWDL